VVGLVGPLGAGKTLLVKGIGSGLGIPFEEITSPTFTLAHVHGEGRVPLVHMDWYRLSDERETELLALGEWRSKGICAVEWADRFGHLLPEDAIWVRFSYEGEGQRRLEVRAAPDRMEVLVTAADPASNRGCHPVVGR
jgi:tRNA threonylcarbamoyladenosine biosynthesis protein TsaE